jgi:condensin-2 complex subunit G2
VLFRAWRTSAGPCVAEMEYGCVQGLLKAALHASTPQLAASLRTVLDGFHQQKAAKGVDSMLTRVYEPLLFRALAAANPAVRSNAAAVAFACFPLQDPTEGADGIDAALAKQFKAFASLTKDPVPSVRAQVHSSGWSVNRIGM